MITFKVNWLSDRSMVASVRSKFCCKTSAYAECLGGDSGGIEVGTSESACFCIFLARKQSSLSCSENGYHRGPTVSCLCGKDKTLRWSKLG